MIEKLRNMTGLYIVHNNRILLLYRQGGRVVNNIWAPSAGGHFEENELNDAEACVLRELKEETNLLPTAFQKFDMRYITLRRTAKEIRQNYYFFAELKEEYAPTVFTSNEGTLKWFDFSALFSPIDSTPSIAMPFTATFVLRHYLTQGRFDENIYGGIADGTQVVFTELPAF